MTDEHPYRSQDDRIICYIPEEGIDWDVIRTDLHSYFGQDATVSREKHPKVGVDKQQLGWLLNMTEWSARILHQSIHGSHCSMKSYKFPIQTTTT